MKRPSLRRLVNVLQPSSTFTTKGDKSITYSADGQYPLEYAAIEPLAGRELVVAKGIRADLTIKITVRGKSNITSDTHLTWNDGTKIHTYQIGPAVDDEFRGAVQSFYCVEIK